MDKYEYRVRTEEISNLIGKERYAEAADIADKIDWRRVKNITMLLRIAALYRVNRRNEDARAVLLLAYERYPSNRSVVQCLCEVSIELDDVVAAIEYYKEFVRIAPKDNGVYTLRYRILEAQEASLEERIELLEEFKKKEYQEEWVYELAYLYHRVGLATKCVEVCDEIILFFGDGAYVMKAMELKMLHAPLTDAQRAKYEVMSRNSNRNYSSEEPYDDSYADEQGYVEEGYTETGYDNQQGYPEDYAGEQGYAEAGYDEQQGYAEQGGYGNYAEADYNGQQGYPEEYGYDNNAYNNEDYGNANYQNADYSGGGYSNENYSENYSNESYADGNYSNVNYSDENYPDENYPDTGYADEAGQNDGYSNDGYADGSYTGESYADNGYAGRNNAAGAYSPQEDGTAQNYTDEFYVDRFYNTDGLPIQAPADAPSAEIPPAEALSANAAAAMEMSQYNTINLERLVFDGMKEVDINDISSDDDADEEQEKSFETRTYVSTKERFENLLKEEKQEQADTLKHSYTEGKVASMVSGVSEESPKPDTGAIKKVIVPGEDARFMKKDTDIASLRDTTEKSVNDEQKRMQENAENVYLEHKQQTAGAADGDNSQEQFKPMTGQMNLEDVLAEWEHIKQENVQKNQEAIKKKVIHKTGEIIANFDNSVKDEMIDGFEEKAAEAEPRTRLEELVADELGGNTAELPDEQISKAVVKIEEVADSSKENIEYADGEEYTSDEAYQDETVGEYFDEAAYAEADEYSDEAEYTEADKYPDEMTYEDDSENPDEAGYAESGEYSDEAEYAEGGEYSDEAEYIENGENVSNDEYADDEYPESDEYVNDGYPENDEYANGGYPESDEYVNDGYSENDEYANDGNLDNEYSDEAAQEEDGEYPGNDDLEDISGYNDYSESDISKDKQKANNANRQLDPDDEESIAEMAKEDALKTQEIKMNTAELGGLSDKILATTRKEANGAEPEEIRSFSPEEQQLFENFAVTKKIKKQIIFALDKMTLAAYTGNVIITGEAGLDTLKLAKNLVKEFQAMDANFSGKVAKITGEKLNLRNLKEVFDKLNNGAIIIEKANGMKEQKLYEMTTLLNQESIGIIVIMEDTKKEITRLLEKQAMIADYFNIRIDLMEMDSKALVAYAKNYALALEYSIDEMGTLALYTRISNMQGGNHVVTKDEVRDIVDEAIWKSKRSKLKNFVDVLLSKRYDSEDMIVLKERDFM